MRKIVIFEMISLDGVVQGPGAHDEDASEGFSHGGWAAPYRDASLFAALCEQVSVPFDLLLGRKTYEIFAPYWPQQQSPIADPFNKARKYVVSNKGVDLTWEESILINGDVPAKIKALKEEDGPMLQIHGCGILVQTLLKHDLVDEMRLRIYPLTLGGGKRLFAEGTTPAAFELLESKSYSCGIITAHYKRAGKIQTGTIGA